MSATDPGTAKKTNGSAQVPKGDISNKLGALHSIMSETFTPIKKANLTLNAKKVLERRYLSKNDKGDVLETPEDLFRRVANNIAQADLLFDPTSDSRKTEEMFYQMLLNLDFLPNSPTLMNAGKKLQQLSACFVLPIGDSMEDIFTTIRDTALIHKSGGGTGFSFSKLRPANSRVASTNGVSSGPISFMRVFDSATEAIKQGGTRRGANMGILRVDHPDIMDFISSKESEQSCNNFNISIALTDEFIEKEKKDEEYDLYDPHTNMAIKKLRAKEVFKKIVSSSWKNGEPGVVFIDRINKENPTPHVGEIESTNPCGEQPLLPYESCNLGSINLSKMIKPVSDPGLKALHQESSELYEIEWNKLAKTVHKAVHFLDNVIEMNKYPLEKIADMTKGNRKIGLGVMGFADMLIRLRVQYNSNEAIHLAEEIMSFIDKESKKASTALADIRGVFPNFEGSIFDEKNEKNETPYKGLRVRNATTTTIAPTGTISIIGSCSSGVEPIFAVSYLRTIMDKDELVEVHPIFEEIAKKRGFYSESLMKKIAKTGNLTGIEEIPKDVRDLFVTAHNVTPEWHIKMQAAFQRHTDNAVSKTINFGKDATEENVREAFLLAIKLKCKGLTIYRDGSREGQVLSTGSTYTSKTDSAPVDKKSEIALTTIPHIVPRPRPTVTRGTTQRIGTGCGNLYVTINECDEGRPFEIFTQMGKAGGCAASQSEAIGRLVSLSLRSGVEPDEIASQMVGISCHMMTWDNGEKVLSCSDAISKALTSYIKKQEQQKSVNEPVTIGNTATTKSLSSKVVNSNGSYKTKESDIVKSIIIPGSMMACPDCGSTTEQADGCVVCRLCGYSKC